MARRPPAPSEPIQANLSIDEMKRGVIRIQKRLEEVEALDPGTIQNRRAPEVTALQTAVDETLAAVFGHNTVEYNRYHRAARLDHGPLMLGHAPMVQEVQRYIAEGKAEASALLKQAIRGLEEEIHDREQAGAAAVDEHAGQADVPALRDLSKVFVVHGHDGEVREMVARFIEKLGFEAIVLHERPNKGRTIITKFREESEGAGFAVVLMTPDDHGGKTGEPTQPRARQNVVFELGFFIGALGPERVAALIKGNVERPSDFDGVVYISLDNGNWKTDFGRELEAAGYPIDWNKVMRG